MIEVVHNGIAQAAYREIASAGIPALSAAVIDGSGRTWGFAVGFADVGTARAADLATVYHLLSGTKLVTATAIMQLADRSAIDLDTPARTYLPDVLSQSAATVRHLLSHTSGLDDTLAGFMTVHLAGEPGVDTATALSRYKIRQRKTPGTAVAYRNVNYALLGEIISRVSGRPYTVFVGEALLQPLGIDASFATTPEMPPLAASGYVGAWGPLWLLAPLLVPRLGTRLFGKRIGWLREVAPFDLDSAAVGGLLGTAASFLPFLQLHLEGNEAVLSEKSRRIMQSMVAKGAAGIASQAGMGLGWKHGLVDGTRFLNHEGGGPGFTSETRIYPDHRLGIVLLMNRWMPPRRSHLVAHRICELVRKGPA